MHQVLQTFTQKIQSLLCEGEELQNCLCYMYPKLLTDVVKINQGKTHHSLLSDMNTRQRRSDARDSNDGRTVAQFLS